MKKIWISILLVVAIVCHARFIPWKSPKLYIPKHFPNKVKVYKWMKRVAAKNSDYIKLVTYGKSVKGQKLLALEIYNKNYNPKKCSLLSGGIHSRELMSVYSTIRFTNKIIRKIKNHNSFWLSYLKRIKLIIIPLLNPDGYDMAMKGWNWRKNTRIYRYRSARYSPNSYGVDLNRNFPVFFKPISFSWHYTWGGPNAFSEPETRSFRNYLKGKKIAVSLSLHSYGRYIAFPWWGSRRKIRHYYKHVKHARVLRRLMRGYKIRQGCPYLLFGNFGDWIYKKYKCLTYTIEIGNSFAPRLRTTKKWYKEIEKGMFYIISRAMSKRNHIVTE